MPFSLRTGLIFLLAVFPAFAQDEILRRQVSELRELVLKLQARVDQLEARDVAKPAAEPAIASGAAVNAQEPVPAERPSGTTVNFGLDGYYGFNFNSPIGRVNLLRAYDVSSNAFSLNQASLVLENLPDPAGGKRLGGRLDLQFGQATETLQGNPANEPRPDIYRNVFQAYGSYVFPLGNGLAVDVGKFASPIGVEGNYTKDQMNYSRSFWFDFLPFYHMGARATYKLNDAVSFTYWLVNGNQQSEPFNGYKDELFGVALQPRKNLTWNANYYLGQEHPDVTYYPNGGAPAGAPNQQGVPFEPVVNLAHGKLHIFNTYFTWQATPKLTLAADLNYVIERELSGSSPQHTVGGAGYLRYQVSPKLAFAARTEYLSDRGGLFTGRTQAVKEETVTLDYKLADGFLLRHEWRTDFSNQSYFYTNSLGVLSKRQTTGTLGLVWWFGPKQGNW